jgi:hypothetical protein
MNDDVRELAVELATLATSPLSTNRSMMRTILREPWLRLPELLNAFGREIAQAALAAYLLATGSRCIVIGPSSEFARELLEAVAYYAHSMDSSQTVCESGPEHFATNSFTLIATHRRVSVAQLRDNLVIIIIRPVYGTRAAFAHTAVPLLTFPAEERRRMNVKVWMTPDDMNDLVGNSV